MAYKYAMTRDQVLTTLRAHEADLRSRGVLHAALFGSVARGDASAESDIDIMIDIDPQARVGVWGYAGMKEYIATLFEGPVDVVNREGLKPFIAPTATAEAIYAF